MNKTISLLIACMLLLSSAMFVTAWDNWRDKVDMKNDCPKFGGYVVNGAEGREECYCGDYSTRLKAALKTFRPDFNEYCFEGIPYVLVCFNFVN